VEPVVELLGEEWDRLYELCLTLSDEEWTRPTECPEWTVHDQVAHIVGTETHLANEALTAKISTLTEPWPPHVHNAIGAMNEAWVHFFRHTPHGALLEEFHRITSVRLAQLRAMPAEAMEALGPSPVGEAPYREALSVRLMDCWVHEQDIRRAVGKPGHREGPIVEQSLDRFRSAMGFVVGKKAGAPAGSTVVFELTGPAPCTFALEVNERAGVTDTVPASPTVRLVMTAETWWCLGLGRWSADSVRAGGLVRIEGDEALGQAVLNHLAFMI
jgi:uncharacterized protein (TIGR03083 family)